MDYQDYEQAYQEHIAGEWTEPDHVNIDGCWYCGGNHPSDCCPSPERDEPFPK